MPGASNKSPGGLGKLNLVSSPTLSYLQFTSRMMRWLPTTNGVEHVCHPKQNGVEWLVSSAEIHRIPVLRPGQNILFRQVTCRSALPACLNVNIALQ